MKYLKYAIWLYFAGAALVMGKEVHLSPDAIRQDSALVTYRLPCDWDGDVAGVKLIGYYGSQEEVATKQPLKEVEFEPDHKERFGPNILLDLPSGILEPVDARSLHHIGIDYGETRRACPADFGGSMLVK